CTPRRCFSLLSLHDALPIFMPFYFDYDLLLLAIPAVLLAREALAGGIIPAWLRRVWAALYAWMYVNAPVAEATRVNVTVLLLAADRKSTRLNSSHVKISYAV